MLDSRGLKTWDLPRVRSYERIGVAMLAVVLATLLFGAIGEPNLGIYGSVAVLLLVGAFVGLHIERLRDALVSGFVAGCAGLWVGYTLFVPAFYALTEEVTVAGLLLAALTGLGLGLALGLLAGATCGAAAVLSSGLSKSRTATG